MVVTNVPTKPVIPFNELDNFQSFNILEKKFFSLSYSVITFLFTIARNWLKFLRSYNF
jgi:hypothetical protein